MRSDPLPDKFLQAFDFASEMAEKEKAHDQQVKGLLLSFLDVLDSFGRFLAAAGDGPPPSAETAAARLRTFRLIGKQIELALRTAGVEPLNSVGQVADPEVHEIVETRWEAESQADEVVEEIRRGYTWNGELLRRPQVVVAGAATRVVEVSSRSVGIAMPGTTRMRVFIPKSTPYPLPAPARMTVMPLNRRIRLAIYEGEEPDCASNAFQYAIEFELPDSVAGDTPVEISFNLDRDRVLTVCASAAGSLLPDRRTHSLSTGFAEDLMTSEFSLICEEHS